jgi:hypothetical protein
VKPPPVVEQKAAKPDLLANLNPRERELVEGTLKNYPGLTVEEAIEILTEFGACRRTIWDVVGECGRVRAETGGKHPMIIWQVRHYISAQDAKGTRIALFLHKADAERFVETKTPSNELEYRVSGVSRQEL